MATASGTRGRTQLDVAQIIENAYQRASGGLVSMISGEQIVTAKQNLFLILSAYMNKGLNLWCVETDTLPVAKALATYSVPQSVIDILNMQCRRGTFTNSDPIINPGEAMLIATEILKVQSVEVGLPSAGAWVLRLEASEDGITWLTITQRTFEVTRPMVVCMDADPSPTVLYWRVVQLAVNPPGATEMFISARFVSAIYEIPFAQMSRDDYMNLPDRSSQGTPTQFWYNKQFDVPRYSLWPVPNSFDYQVVLTSQKEVQDVGEMSNILAVPSRWLGAVISELAVRMYFTLPKGARTDIPLADLRQIAKDDLRDAEDSEVDGGPITLAPLIGVYTR